MLRRIALLAAAAIAFGTAAVVTGGSAAQALPPGYKANSALINADTVTTGAGIVDGSGNPISLEQFAAEQAGFKVTVVTGAQWVAMTAADFAKYQLLIIGDPDCRVMPDSATSTSNIWGKVVLGKSGLNPAVGNRALVGTDPEFHYMNGGGNAAPSDPADPTTAGAERLVQSGITYAGAVAGATGVYFTTSCGDNGQIEPTLNRLTATGTGFTLDTSPPCGGNVAQIAKTSAFTKLKDTDIAGWGCSVHITFPTYPTDWQPLILATDTATKPTCGTGTDTGVRECGEAYVLIAGRDISATAPDLKLTPVSGEEPAGSTHTVTATVTKSGAAASGIKVTFDLSGVNAGVTGTCSPASCNSNASGKVSFTYTDENGVGHDEISATATIAGSTERATATVDWVVVANRRPTAKDQYLTTPINTPKTITLKASDPDGDPLTYRITHQPKHGSLRGSGPTVVYTPDNGFTGPDFFVFTASDAEFTTREHVVNIQVLAPGETSSPPLAGTGPHTAAHIDFGLVLVGLGTLLLVLGLVRFPRGRRQH